MPNYDFKSLSSYDFELLTRDLLQLELGVTLESFKPGRDSGIDLRYSQDAESTFIIQCKHYASSSFSTLISHLEKKEKSKVDLLRPARYLLVTSVGLSPGNKDDILKIFDPFCLSPADIYGKDDLNNLLGKFPDIEKSNFKLWLTSQTVLDRILHSSIFNQSEYEIESIKKKTKYYVPTRSFDDAKRITDEMHYCVITGIPGIGKTTLAEILIVDYIDRGYQAIKITSDISEAYKVLDRSTKQVFYYDDFLGQTSLGEKLNKNEDQSLLRFIEIVRQSDNTKFILTTRDYILNHAKSVYERLAHSDFDLRKCIVDLASYTRFDKAQILFNHLYFSEIPAAYKEALLTDKSYLKIIDHRNYNPRIIEWMTDYLKRLDTQTEDYVETFLANLDDPKNLWEHAFEHQLSAAARNLMIVLSSLPERVLVDDLESAFNSFHYQQSKRYGLASSPRDFVNTLKELEGNFISIENSEHKTIIKFHNPSIRDFLEGYRVANVEMVGEIIESAVYFPQCEDLWGLCKICGQLVPGRLALVSPFSEVFLISLERCFESASCGLHKVHDVTNNTIYDERDKVYLEARLIFIYRVLEDLDTEEGQDLFKRLLTRLFNNYENSIGDKGNLLFLLKSFKEKGFVHVSSKQECLSLVKAFYMQGFVALEDFERFLDFKDIFPKEITKDDFDVVRNEFSDFYEEDINSLCFDVDDSEFVRDYAELLEQVASAFEISLQEELDRLAERTSELEEEEARHESDEDPDDDWRRGSTGSDSHNTDGEIESLFGTLLE